MHALALIQDTSSQMSSQQAQQLVSTFAGAYVFVMLLVFVVKVVLYTIPMWRICKRAGMSPQLSLLCAIPLLGRLITVYVIAFADWKVPPAGYNVLVPPSYPPAYPPLPPVPPSYPPSQPPTV